MDNPTYLRFLEKEYEKTVRDLATPEKESDLVRCPAQKAILHKDFPYLKQYKKSLEILHKKFST